ncbi:unnamed protein product [Choristocarpus tenellus]
MLPLGAVRGSWNKVGHKPQRSTPKLPPSPPKPTPFLVLFPGKSSLAISCGPPATPKGMLTIVGSALLTVVFRSITGFQLFTAAGLWWGTLGGILVGAGLRAREKKWSYYKVLLVLGVALLGGGWDSLLLVLALILSFLWGGGWWMHHRMDWAAGALMVVGVGFNVVFGFIIASAVQVHHAKGEDAPVRKREQKTQEVGRGPNTSGILWTPIRPGGLR